MFYNRYKCISKNTRVIKIIRNLSIAKGCLWIVFFCLFAINLVLRIKESYHNDTIFIISNIQMISVIGIFILWQTIGYFAKKDLKSDQGYNPEDKVDKAFLLYRDGNRELNIKIKQEIKRCTWIYVLAAILFVSATSLFIIDKIFQLKIELLAAIILIGALVFSIFIICALAFKCSKMYQKFIDANRENIEIILT